MQRHGATATILAAAAANGKGTSLDVSRYSKVMVAIIGATAPALTVKCQGSGEMTSNTSLDFGAAQSATNPWEYIQMYDMNSGVALSGSTGVVFAGTAAVRMFQINADAIRTLNFIISGYSAGSCTVIAYPIE